ncbi:MAG TPA: DUF2723 domain-containing protein [Vicinamibacterales bacterium]|nr:DUF2723 domain-containing protein [Vicinamibacterales bacterium]
MQADNVRADRIAWAAVLATAAFYAYARTLLPGVDLGDTGGFQAAVLWPGISARQAYPLYYGLAHPFVAAVAASNPARGLNLFSAVCGGAAVGLLTWIVAAVADSTLAGVTAGMLLGASYTFWTQAIIAEVYTLHLALVGVCLVAIAAFARRPTRPRLAIFFAVYALAFGNHLSMVLLLVPFAVFLLQAHPRPRELFKPAIIAMALVIAAAGALQYLPNLLAVRWAATQPIPLSEQFAGFWFDVTKADWRETMVLGVHANQVTDRLAMWFWDARQQFGLAGLVLAVAGGVRIWTMSRTWAVFLWLAYLCSTLFALTYNVGDTHVFFLPSHYFTAFAAGIAVAPYTRGANPLGARGEPERLAPRRMVFTVALACAAIAYGGWRAWDTWPAVDRSHDTRGEQLVASVASGVDDQHAILLSGMEWQSENALLYGSRFEYPRLAWTRVADVLPHLPFLVRDNAAIGRDVVLTEEAAREIVSAYGSRFPIVADDAAPVPSLNDTVALVPRGAPYVLTRLTPTRDQTLDPRAVDAAVATLTGGHPPKRTPAAYEAVAGTAGDAPVLYRASNRPFRQEVSIAGDLFTIRMESWLTIDTFRRAGFGQVERGREHALIVERGVSLVWFGANGRAHVAYAAGLYAPRHRYRIGAPATQLARAE